jgi:pimeloyl-ACP methyl ester carboxylesterase
MQRPAGEFPEERYASPWEDLKTLPGAVYVQDLIAVTDPPPSLGEIRAPTLALLSSGAAFTHAALTARHLAELPHCETVVLEARHWLPTEQPEAMRRAIDAWCLGLEAPRE